MKTLFSWKWLLRLAVMGVIAVGALAWIDRHVGGHGEGRLYTSVRKVPARPVALLLGTAKFVRGNRRNLFYAPRIRAAAALYHAGKVRGILVSGDNSRHSYNEPERMKEDLVRLGVPARYISLDFAGRRTLDSVVRAKDIFGQSALIVVSQAFHCQRALYLADANGIDAVAFIARGVRGPSRLRIRLREVVARARAFLDVNLLATEPRFRGKRETVALKPRKVVRPKAKPK